MNNVTLNIDQAGSHPFVKMQPALLIQTLKTDSVFYRQELQLDKKADKKHQKNLTRQTQILSCKFALGIGFKLQKENYIKLMRNQGFFTYDIKRIYSARFEDFNYQKFVQSLRGAKNVLFTIQTPSCHVFGGFINAQINGVGNYQDPTLRSFLFCMNQTHQKVAYYFNMRKSFYSNAKKQWQILRIQNQIISIGGNDLVIQDGKRGQARIGRIQQGFSDNGLGAKMARRKLTGSDQCNTETTFFKIKQIEVYETIQ